MGSWAQWHASREELRRAWFVYGRDSVVVEQVVADIRARVGGDLSVLIAGEVEPREVWAEINSFIAPGANRRLVVIRGAEDISDWLPFEDWLSARNQRGVHVLFVSSQEEIDTKKPGLRKMVGGTAVRTVRCSLSSEERKDQQKRDIGCEGADWVASLTPMDYPQARRLWAAAGHDSGKAMQVVDKARLLGVQIDEGMIAALIEPEGPEDFCLELAALRKDRALEALRSMSEDEYGLTVGRMEYRLTQLRRLNRAMKTAPTTRDAIRSVKMDGVPNAGLLASVSHHYDHVRASKCVRALAIADTALRTGETVGPIEALVALW